MSFLIILEKNMPIKKKKKKKKKKGGEMTPPLPQTPYGLWVRPNIENLSFVLAMVKMYSQQRERNYYTV